MYVPQRLKSKGTLCTVKNREVKVPSLGSQRGIVGWGWNGPIVVPKGTSASTSEPFFFCPWFRLSHNPCHKFAVGWWDVPVSTAVEQHESCSGHFRCWSCSSPTSPSPKRLCYMDKSYLLYLFYELRIKSIKAVKNIAISSETRYPSRVCRRKPPLTVTFSQLKASQQKSWNSLPWRSGPGSQASTGKGSRMKNWGGKQIWGLWSNGLLFPCFLKHFAPFSICDPAHLQIPPRLLLSFVDLWVKHQETFPTLSYLQRRAAQTVICFVYT